MDIVPQNKTEAQIEIESVFNQMPTQEALENPFISLGDGSSSSPNLRAVEMVMTAIFANRYKGVVLTNFYHGASFRESADKIGLWLRDMEFDFKLDRDLLELHYIPYFRDPQMRIDNMVSRMRDKGKSEAEIEARINRFMSVLPVSVFSANGTSFVDFIKKTRQETTTLVMEHLGLPGQQPFKVEAATEGFGGTKCNEEFVKSEVSLKDILKPEDEEFFDNLHVMQIACPECSISNGNEIARHSVAFNGEVYQRATGVMQNGSLVTNCKHIGTLKENLKGRSILDIPIFDLINLGFKFSGKALFLIETRLGKNQVITQAIRAYSNSNGTIRTAASINEGVTVLTPSIYINVEDDSSKNGFRDANIFELIGFMSTPEGLEVLKRFVQDIPMFDDGLKRTLNITTGRISIIPMPTINVKDIEP